jgi:phage gp29-like protein
MAEQAIELKKGDSRLTEEITPAETLFAAGIPSWLQWATFESDRNPSSVWQKMVALEGAGAIPHYRDMYLKDGHYASQLLIRTKAVLSKTWRVNPTGSGDKVAEFIEDALWGIDSFERGLRSMLDALGKGVSVQEILYARDGARLVIESLKARPQEAFAFNEPGEPPTGPLRLSLSARRAGAGITGGAGSTGVRAPGSAADAIGILPANKFVVTTFEMQEENRWGDALGRHCFWLTWFKRQSVKFWLKFIEKGTGTVVANYPSGASAEDRQQALEAARAINQATYVAKSERFLVELLEKARAGSGAGEVFKGLVEGLCNTEMSLLIRGQTLTSRGGDQGSGSMALGEVHERVSNLVLESDAKMLAETVQQQIVDPLTALNFGPDTEPPEFVIEAEEGEDLDKFTDRMTKVTKMIAVPEQYIYETLQVPEPDAGEEVVEAVQPAVAPDDPNAGRETKPGARRDDKSQKGGATNLAERGATGAPVNDPGDPEPRVIEAEALQRGRGMYAQFISGLIERAGKELPE